MRTPHASLNWCFLLSKYIFCYYFDCNLHNNNLQHENISVRRHIFALEVMAYWYGICIQAFKVYALSAIMKHSNLLGWLQNKILHSSMQTSRNASLVEANAKLLKFLRKHALIVTKLLYFCKKYSRLECVHHDDLNYIHQKPLDFFPINSLISRD